MSTATGIAERIARITGPGPVALHEPDLSGNEAAYVNECIATNWVSSVGKYVDRFEADLAAFTGVKHAVVVSNGTSALHIALVLAGVEPGDEVLVPALTFVATANAVSHCGALPHFIDSDFASLGVSVVALENYLNDIATLDDHGACRNRLTGSRIKAIAPMHTFGHPVDMPALVALTQRWNIVIVEDAAEALGSYIDGVHAGQHGLLATLSFNGNKTLTTGGGGAIITNDAGLAARAKHLTTTAKQKHPWAFIHDEVAYNYRMPNLNAAMGCAQLERLGGFLVNKRALTGHYLAAFDGFDDASVFVERAGTRSNYWLQTLLLSPDQAAHRDDILNYVNGIGIQIRPVWELMNRLEMYRHCPSAALPVAEELAARIINIPSSPGLAARLETA